MLMMRTIPFTLCTIALAIVGENAYAQNVGSYGRAPRPDNQDNESVNLPIKRKLGEKVPLDVKFYDHDAKPVTLGSLMDGKPTILVPAYYRCPKMCMQVIEDLLLVLRKMRSNDSRYAAGDAFNVVIFSIDPKEPPELARPKREYYLNSYDGRDPGMPGWWFLTATHGQFNDVKESKAEIRKMTNSLGYPFLVKDQKTVKNSQGQLTYDNEWGEATLVEGSGFVSTGKSEKDFRHTSAIVILTPDGRISQYHMGVAYDAENLRRMIDTAAKGEIGTDDDKQPLQCVNVDKVSDFYRTAMRILAYAAIPFGFLVVGIATYSVSRARKERKAREESEQVVERV